MQKLLLVIVATACSMAGCAGARVETKELNALWAMAPADATLGVVIAPRGLAMLERSVQAVRAMIDQVPELAVARPMFERVLTHATGTPQPTLDALGMARDQGLAVFGYRRNTVVILPVKDRAKFVAAVHGSPTATGDAVLGWVCKPIERRYVCASDAALWDQLGHDGLASVRASLEVRGDLELAARKLEDMGSAGVAACARLETGSVVIRGALTAMPPAMAAKIAGSGAPPATAAAAAGFAVFDLARLYNHPKMTMEVAPQVSFAALEQSIAWPLTLEIAAATGATAIRVPLRDPAPMAAWLAQCTVPSVLAGVGFGLADGHCRIASPNLGVILEGRVEDRELRFGGTPGVAAGQLAPTPLASELAGGRWFAAVYGRGAFLDLQRAYDVRGMFGAKDMLLIARLFQMVNEVGVGLRVEGDAVHFVAGVRTAWTNPDDVIRKLFAVTPAQLARGQGKDLARAIAVAAPASPFAADAQASPDGAAIAASLWFATMIAIPTMLFTLFNP